MALASICVRDLERNVCHWVVIDPIHFLEHQVSTEIGVCSLQGLPSGEFCDVPFFSDVRKIDSVLGRKSCCIR